MKKPTFTMQHIGINGKDRDEAVQIVTLFASIFDLELRTEKKVPHLREPCIEAMAGNGPAPMAILRFMWKIWTTRSPISKKRRENRP